MKKVLFFLTIVSVFVMMGCGNQNADSHFKNANAKFQLKNYPGAIEDLNYAIKSDKSNIKAYYLRAICFTKMDDPDNALKDFNKVLELDPNYKEAYLNRAFYVKVQKEQYKEAIDDYNSFIGLNTNGDNSYALNNRGYAYYMLQDYDAAIDDINASLEINQANSFAFKNRALVYIAVDSLSLACDDLQKAIDLGYSNKYDDEVLRLQIKHCPN